MDGHGHVVAVRFHHHFLQLLGREEQQTTGGGIVGIGLAQIGRPGTQRAVCQQLDAGDLETAVAKAVIPAVLVEESLHFLQTVHQRLFRHAQLEDALVRGFADAFHHVISAAVGEVFEVVALDGGDAAFKQVGLALDHLFQQLLQTGGRQVALDIIQNDLLDNTVGSTVRPALGIVAVLPHGVLVDAQQLHGLGVHGAHVETGAHHQNGIFGGNSIQIPVGGEAFFVGEAVLVPAFANHPQAGVFVIAVFKIVLHPLYQIGHGSAAEQLSAHLGLAVVHIVHMAVVEAGQQELAFAVQFLQFLLGTLGQKGGSALFVAYIGKEVADNHGRSGNGVLLVHGGDFRVFDPKRHKRHLCKTNFFILSISRKRHLGNEKRQKIRACFFLLYPLY